MATENSNSKGETKDSLKSDGVEDFKRHPVIKGLLLASTLIVGSVGAYKYALSEIDARVTHYFKLNPQTRGDSGPAGPQGPKGEQGLQGPAGTTTLLAGMVVAFDRSSGGDGPCPQGWSLFREAGGRFIIGAGQHGNGVPEFPSYSDNPASAVGGTPTHSHSVDGVAVRSTSQGIDDIGVVAFEAGTENKGFPIKTFSESSMPPYLALYFCKKS
jgi:hypothetical protein